MNLLKRIPAQISIERLQINRWFDNNCERRRLDSALSHERQLIKCPRAHATTRCLGVSRTQNSKSIKCIIDPLEYVRVASERGNVD